MTGLQSPSEYFQFFRSTSSSISPDEIVIAFYMGAAGRRDLDEDEPFFILRILLQEPVDRQEPFDDPFRVIDPLTLTATILPARFNSSRIFSFCFRTLSVGVPKTLRSTLMGKARTRVSRPLLTTLNFPYRPGIPSGGWPYPGSCCSGSGRETRSDRSPASLPESPPGRDRSKRPPDWARDVPEQGDGRIRAFLFDHLRQEREVIVLDEDERFVHRQLFEKAFGEFFR